MPSSTRLETPGPSNPPQSSKRAMSDSESAPQDPKRPRRNLSAEPITAQRDSNRDTKRRRRRKKKAPIVGGGLSKNEAPQGRLDERSRAPLSARNEVIRFTSAPLEADPLPNIVPQGSSLKLHTESQEVSSLIMDDTQNEAMPSAPIVKKRVVPTNSLLEASSSSLEGRVAQLEAELKCKNDLIKSHQTLLGQVQQAVTCQVCLDLMYKPYALAPCGHLACYSCLVNWFTAPPPDNRPVPPAITRRKTCPHCRAVVRERPAEVWGVKSIAQAVGKSGLLPNLLPVPVEAPESLNANADPWKDIFPKPGATSHRGFPWFFPGVDIDDEDIQDADIAPRGEDLGMLDMEDGGIYRCLDCMHEIWDGVCSSCGRVYPGHRHDEDEEGHEGDPVGWFDDQTGAEEVDVADDPGWMGLEDGEADDSGDMDEWHPFAPWRRGFHWGFLGTIHVDDEDEEEDDEDEYGRTDELRIPDGSGDSDDGSYESSFIDDGEGDRIADFVDSSRNYEVGDEEEEEDYRPIRRSRGRRIVELLSDDREQDEEEASVGQRWASRSRSNVAVWSDDEDAGHSRQSGSDGESE